MIWFMQLGGKWAPHRKADQYLIWINRETKMIEYIQGTVREIVGRSITALALTDYREVYGMKMPFNLKAIADINIVDEIMHEMKLSKVEQVEEDLSKQLLSIDKNKAAK